MIAHGQAISQEITAPTAAAGLMHDFYTITELTKEFGVSTRTIRFSSLKMSFYVPMSLGKPGIPWSEASNSLSRIVED